MRAFLALLLAASAAAAEPKTVDLSAQFPDAATRDQGATGGCHVFTTVSLIEAAVWRRHALRLPLSEADLFVRKVVEDPGYYARARKAVGAGDGAASAYSFVEGGSPYDDIAFALKSGVAMAQSAPWSAFAARYDAFRKARKAEIERKRGAVVMTAGAVKQVGDDYAEIGRSEASGNSDRMAQVARANLKRVEYKVDEAHRENLADFGAFLDQVAGKTKAEAEEALLGPGAPLAVDRASVAKITGVLRIKKLDFDSACKDGGRLRKAGLLLALDRGIPVSVAMDLAGLPEWHEQSAKGAAWHAFTITGYSKDAAGTLTLRSRNSWGGDNPPVPEERFCRIRRLVAVLSDKE